MKEYFSGFYQPTDDELTLIWKTCTFILDSNFLLNLYRYPDDECAEILNILEKVSDRLWIPHQIALDYQRNRTSVIFFEEERFTRVAKELKKYQLSTREIFLQLGYKRGELNNIVTEFLDETDEFFNNIQQRIESLTNEFTEKLNNQSIIERIDTLFREKVGPPPNSQDELDELYSLGKKRFEHNIPPGYKDLGKKEYSYGGFIFQQAYADFIAWEQIIQYAKESKLEHVVFITDDIKEDWWLKTRTKIIGPRPELVEELCSKSGVKSFYMYNSEQFLTSANNYLNSPISKKFFKELKLKKADSFLVEKEKPAAAVTAGIALEHHLRDLCDKNGLQTTKIINSSGKEEFKKASRLNGELYSQKEAYPKSYLDNISAWLGIRNDAAHGNDENYTEEQVRLMIMGITHFMNNYPS